MLYLLDTSVIISFLRHKEEARNFISSHINDELITSCICEAEIAGGIYREEKEKISLRQEQVDNLFSTFSAVLPFDGQQADLAGKIKAELQKSGQLIDDLDILIAAAVLASQAVLVTFNYKHFQRIKNLQIYKF